MLNNLYMNTKELMIGNWINTKNGVPVCVVNIDQGVIGFDSNANGSNESVSDFSGIKLTPEILKKAGFENGAGAKVMLPLKKDKYTCYLWLEFIDDRVYLLTADDGHDYHLVDDIQHLHRLQNLYSVLMGKELQVDL